jgi:hypothetical protein
VVINGFTDAVEVMGVCKECVSRSLDMPRKLVPLNEFFIEGIVNEDEILFGGK